jgi:hypothetical protein
MPTKREYLAGLNPPLAKIGRGRFSKAALEAIAAAEAAGTVFDEPVTVSKEVAAEGDETPSQHPKPTSESSLIRAWAADNGISVGQRGRIPVDVIAAYQAGDPGTLGKPVQKYVVQPQVRIRQLRSMYGLDDAGHTVGFAICRRCREHINYCACKSGPKPPSIVVKVIDRTDPA